MKIAAISLLHLTIPFKWQFSHSSQIRNQTDSIIAIVRCSDGTQGYGEGTPRPYVTGEDSVSCKEAAKLLSSVVVNLNLGSLRSFIGDLRELGTSKIARQNPSAWCCLELALLDLWFKRRGLPVWRMWSERPKFKCAEYSAGFPLAPAEKLVPLCNQVKSLGISKLKVKLCDIVSGIDTIRFLREELGGSVEIRVDFNEALSAGDALSFARKAQQFNIAAIEQPVSKHDLVGLEILARQSPIPIIADESLFALESPQEFIKGKFCHGVNIRISSCGGLLNTISLLSEAEKAHMLTQLGSHVGETAILAAAGRTIVAAWGRPNYLEGSAGKYLLQEDVANEDISFGRSGLAPVLDDPGLGIQIDDRVLQTWGNSFSQL